MKKEVLLALVWLSVTSCAFGIAKSAPLMDEKNGYLKAVIFPCYVSSGPITSTTNTSANVSRLLLTRHLRGVYPFRHCPVRANVEQDSNGHPQRSRLTCAPLTVDAVAQNISRVTDLFARFLCPTFSVHFSSLYAAKRPEFSVILTEDRSDEGQDTRAQLRREFLVRNTKGISLPIINVDNSSGAQNAGNDGALDKSMASTQILASSPSATSATISAAYSALAGRSGTILVKCGTYSENLLISTAVNIWGEGENCVTIKPALVGTEPIRIDATSVGSIDGIDISGIALLCPPNTTCENALTITGKQTSDQSNDHITLEHIKIGTSTRNIVGTFGFKHGLNITGRTIWSTFYKLRSQGNRGDGLHVALAGGLVGPINACVFRDSEFSENFGYGVSFDGSGASSLSRACNFENVNIEFNGNNPSLKPCAGALFQGVDQMDLHDVSFEENCVGNSDVYRAHLRLTGRNVRTFNISGGSYVNDTPTGAKYAIFADADVINGYWTGMERIGNGYTAGFHIAVPASGDMRTVPVIGPNFNMGVPEIVLDANGNSRAMSLSPLAFPVWQVGTAHFPVSHNSIDLTNAGTAIPSNVISLTGGPYSINKITGATTGQILIVRNTSTSLVTLHNGFGEPGQITFNDSADRVLHRDDSVLLYSQDGLSWNELALGAALRNEANTWTAGQTFTAISNGKGFQAFSVTNTCTTAARQGATCTTPAITLPVGYSDSNYRLSCTGLSPNNVPIVQAVTKGNTSFTITIATLTAAAASYPSYDCIAVHN